MVNNVFSVLLEYYLYLWLYTVYFFYFACVLCYCPCLVLRLGQWPVWVMVALKRNLWVMEVPTSRMKEFSVYVNPTMHTKFFVEAPQHNF